MPIYEYRCKKCGKNIEQTFSVQNHPTSVSCICGGMAERVISAVGVIIPYKFKTIKPYTPEISDVKRETEEICSKKGWNPHTYLDDSFYNGSRE